MNANHKSALDYCCVILKFIGFYHEGDPTAEFQRRRRISCSLMMFMAITTLFGNMRGIIVSENLIKLAEQVSYFLLTLVTAMKSWIVILKREQISMIKQKIIELEKQIAEDERHKNLQHLKIRLDFTSKNYTAFTKLVALTLVFMIISTIALGKYPIDIFGELDDGPIAGYISAIFMNLVAAYGAVVLTSVNMLPVILVPYAIGFNDELAARLKFIGISKEFDFDEIKECIKIHQMINNFVDEFNDCFRPIFYLQNIYSQLIICSFVFNLANAANLNDLIMSLALATISISEILLPCYFGSELEKSSENLTDAIYQSDWLNCELKTKKLMVTFMENLKQPMQINCYLIFNINLEMFANIINAAYSFYCVLVELA